MSEEASDEVNSTRLLDRLLAHEWTGLDPEFRRARFQSAVRRARFDWNEAILDWWLLKYLPANADNLREVVVPAIQYGRIKVLEWLEQRQILPHNELQV